MEKKKKGSGKVLIAIGAVLVALAVAIVSVGMYFEGVLNTYVGMGEAKVVAKPGSENWDSEYYKADKPTADEVDVIAKDVTKRIAEEGITLMKNNGILPLAGNESVSLFGRRSVDTVWGGTGSGAGDASQCTPIAEAFTAQGFKVNDTLTKLYADNLDKVPTGYNAMDKLPALTFYIGEFPMSYYTGAVTGSYASYKDAAFVVIGRSGGEGMDLSTDLKGAIASTELAAMTADHPETANYTDGQHSLELTFEEKELLKHVEENFDKVIVIVNSANVMELIPAAAAMLLWQRSLRVRSIRPDIRSIPGRRTSRRIRPLPTQSYLRTRTRHMKRIWSCMRKASMSAIAIMRPRQRKALSTMTARLCIRSAMAFPIPPSNRRSPRQRKTTARSQ